MIDNLFEQLFDEDNNHFVIRNGKRVIVGCKIGCRYFYCHSFTNKTKHVFVINLN